MLPMAPRRTHINEIPNEILLQIFSDVPSVGRRPYTLRTLGPASLVNQQWRFLVQSVLYNKASEVDLDTPRNMKSFLLSIEHHSVPALYMTLPYERREGPDQEGVMLRREVVKRSGNLRRVVLDDFTWSQVGLLLELSAKSDLHDASIRGTYLTSTCPFPAPSIATPTFHLTTLLLSLSIPPPLFIYLLPALDSLNYLNLPRFTPSSSPELLQFYEKLAASKLTKLTVGPTLSGNAGMASYLPSYSSLSYVNIRLADQTGEEAALHRLVVALPPSVRVLELNSENTNATLEYLMIITHAAFEDGVKSSSFLPNLQKLHFWGPDLPVKAFFELATRIGNLHGKVAVIYGDDIDWTRREEYGTQIWQPGQKGVRALKENELL